LNLPTNCQWSTYLMFGVASNLVLEHLHPHLLFKPLLVLPHPTSNVNYSLIPTHLSMKIVSFVWSFMLRSPNLVPLVPLGTIGKPCTSKGAQIWFRNVWTYSGKVIEYWTKFSLKIHSNQNYKIIMEFGHSLGNVEKTSVSRI
jgi:hypothetical protein